MTRSKCKILIGLALAWLALPSVADAVQKDVDGLVSESQFPWFDAEANELRGGPVPVSQESAVDDRHSIAPYVETAKKQKAKPKTGAAAPVSMGSTQVFNAIIYTVGGIALVCLIGLLIWAIYRSEDIWGAEKEKGKKKKRSMKDHIRHLPFEMEEQEGDFKTAAESAMAAGDYSHAVICLYAELLVVLDENDLVRLQRGRTNRQYLNAIREHEPLATYFQSVMTAFEDAFFGKHVISQARARECFGGKAEFEQQAQRIKAAKFAASRNRGPSLAEVGA